MGGPHGARLNASATMPEAARGVLRAAVLPAQQLRQVGEARRHPPLLVD
jgi:hypothetical protein